MLRRERQARQAAERRAEEERQRADEIRRRADEIRQHAYEERQRAYEERQFLINRILELTAASKGGQAQAESETD